MGVFGRLFTYLGGIIVTLHGASTLMAADVTPAASAIPGVSAGDPSVNGTLVLITGLTSLFLPTIVSQLNRWIADRKEERLAKLERHKLADRVQALEFENTHLKEEAKSDAARDQARIAWLEQMVTENRELIERLSDPYATHVVSVAPTDPEEPHGTTQ